MRGWFLQKKAARQLLALVSGIAVICALHSGGKLINLKWLAGVAWTLPILAAGIWLTHKRCHTGLSQRQLPLIALVAVTAIYCFSSATTNSTFYFPDWVPSSPHGIGKSWLERTLLLTAILIPIITISRRRFWMLLTALLFTTQIAAFIALWKATGGEPLYRVDHPAFFLRLWSFGKSMPRFIFYDPFWNGGKVMPYLVASGILSPGIFLWPVWKFVQTHTAYTPAFGFLFLIVVPALAAFSARLLNRSRSMSVVAALLSLGTCHFYFIHLVHYGTIGSLFSATFLMPLSAALYRMVMRQKTDPLTLATLFIAGFFLLCWPPAAIMAIPIGVALICNIKQITRQTLLWLVAFVLAMLATFSMPTLSLLTHSNIQAFAHSSEAPFSSVNLLAGWQVLTKILRQTHPVLLFSGLLGVFFLPSRGIRRWFAPCLATSVLIVILGTGWKPTLQLDRTLINALFIAILPAAHACATLLQRPRRATVPAAALLSAMLVMGGYNCVKYMGNRGRAKFRTMSPEVQNMVAWLKQNTPQDGRIMFAGAAVHGYSAAKIAALPIYTEREMMSCDYYGFSPKLVEYNYPPKEFRKHGKQRLF